MFFGFLILHSGIGHATGVFSRLAVVVALSIVAHSSTDVLVARRVRPRWQSAVTLPSHCQLVQPATNQARRRDSFRRLKWIIEPHPDPRAGGGSALIATVCAIGPAISSLADEGATRRC